MPPQVDFYFDVGSPAAYLAFTQIEAIAREAGASVNHKPMLLGGVFQATGNASPATVPAKGAYTFIDFARHAKRYGVTLIRNPHFPINTLMLMRAITGAQMHASEREAVLIDAIFKAIWTEQLNMNDPEVASVALANAGFPAGLIASWIGDAAVKARLKETTDEAVARGVFGAPTMFVGDEMFFGQDRLEWVREALAAA